jgi:hypothetical protein
MEMTIQEESNSVAISAPNGDYCNLSETEIGNDSEIINSLELNQLREIIENMTKFNQTEILRILQSNNAQMSENRYGVHINMSELSPSVIAKLKSFVKYVNTQEKQLHKIEKQKESFISTYFQKR